MSSQIVRDVINLNPPPAKPKLYPLAFVPLEQLKEMQTELLKELQRRDRLAERDRRTAKMLRSLAKSLEISDSRRQKDEFYEEASSRFTIAALNPAHLAICPSKTLRCLAWLLRQNWSHLWAALDKTPKYYVYAHVDPDGKILNTTTVLGRPLRMPFYIGKGCGDRAYNFVRNQGHGIRLKRLIDDGESAETIVQIVRSGLTEREALELEAKLVYFFGRVYEKDRCGVLLNLDPCPRPQFAFVMPTFQEKGTA